MQNSENFTTQGIDEARLCRLVSVLTVKSTFSLFTYGCDFHTPMLLLGDVPVCPQCQGAAWLPKHETARLFPAEETLGAFLQTRVAVWLVGNHVSETAVCPRHSTYSGITA